MILSRLRENRSKISTTKTPRHEELDIIIALVSSRLRGKSFNIFFLLFPRQRLDSAFLLERTRPAPAGFLIYKLYRASALSIARGPAAVVLFDASWKIVRDPGIESAVAAFNNVEMPAA